MITINPQTFLNGFFSTQRNMYLTSAIGLTLYGISNNTTDETIHNSLEYTSLFMFIYSCSICWINSLELKRMTTLLQSDKDEYDETLDLNTWDKYFYLNISYIIVLFILVLAIIEKKFNYIKD
jgi:hypothetical protein